MAAQLQSDLIEKAVQGVLKQIEENAPEEYKKLTAEPARKAEIIKAARETATETLKLTEEFRDDRPKDIAKSRSKHLSEDGIQVRGGRADQPKDIAKILSKHLSEDRIQLIQGGLKIPTFQLTIAKSKRQAVTGAGKLQSDSFQYAHMLQFTREGEEFLPTRMVASVADIDWGKLQQFASIAVEAVFLVISTVGISITPSGNVMNQVVGEAAEAIQGTARLRTAIEAFVRAWNATGGSAYGRSKALFGLIKEIYSTGFLWKTIKKLCSNMAWYDWLLIPAKVIALIVASIATEGAVLIAKIVLSLTDAVDFVLKIVNVVQLSEILKTL